MKNVLKSVMIGLTALGGAVATVSLSTPAVAQSSSAKSVVEKAKRDGVVGETIEGYLALVNGRADRAVTDAMNEINIGRKAVYTRRARAQGVSVEVLATLTGEQQVAKAKPGMKVRDASGRWVSVR